MSDELLKRKTLTTLPTTTEDLAQRYNMKRDRNLNDLVEDHFRVLIEDDEFRKYIDEIHREDAVEGDLFLDDAQAAEMIRSRARVEGDFVTSSQKLKALIRALKVVMKRFEIGRDQRRGVLLNGED